MKLGIAGISKSGKTTIFNAITGLNADISSYEVKLEPNMAVVTVNDDRVTHLSEIYNPKKTVYATVDFIDFPGMKSDDENREFLPASAMTMLKTTDALVLTLRNFSDAMLDDMLGVPDPEKELKFLLEEFMFSDLVIAEKRLEKIELAYKRGQKTANMLIEEKAIRKAIESITNGVLLSDVDFPEEELRAIKGFMFLSLKPKMVILNSCEKNFGKNTDKIEKISKIAPVYEFAGKFEMDLNQLDDSEREVFMDDMGLSESAVDRVIDSAYKLLGYISFFTVGDDEVRAWTITSGENAVSAAGKIHSDLARGFIRAETFTYDDIANCKTERVIREKGLFRLEGKNYIVKDGDIICIRFSV
jgi:hypothetical protein